MDHKLIIPLPGTPSPQYHKTHFLIHSGFHLNVIRKAFLDQPVQSTTSLLSLFSSLPHHSLHLYSALVFIMAIIRHFLSPLTRIRVSWGQEFLYCSLSPTLSTDPGTHWMLNKYGWIHEWMNEMACQGHTVGIWRSWSLDQDLFDPIDPVFKYFSLLLRRKNKLTLQCVPTNFTFKLNLLRFCFRTNSRAVLRIYLECLTLIISCPRQRFLRTLLWPSVAGKWQDLTAAGKCPCYRMASTLRECILKKI